MKRGGPIKRRKRLSSPWNPRRYRADRVARELALGRDSHHCQRCGEWMNLEVHHVHSRRYGALRHVLDNLLTLCTVCHRWWHANPKEAYAWWRERVGSERAEALETAKRLRKPAGEER